MLAFKHNTRVAMTNHCPVRTSLLNHPFAVAPLCSTLTSPNQYCMLCNGATRFTCLALGTPCTAYYLVRGLACVGSGPAKVAVGQDIRQASRRAGATWHSAMIIHGTSKVLPQFASTTYHTFSV